MKMLNIIIIREMEIKTTSHLSEWLLSKRLETTNASKDGGKENPVYCLLECKLVQPLRKIIWKFLKKLKIVLPYTPEIRLLDIYLKKKRTLIRKKKKNALPFMFTAALLAIAKIWKQPNLSVYQWMNG